MRPPREVPPGARLAGDALLVILTALALAAVALFYPAAPSAPRYAPQVERPDPPALPR